MEEKGNILLHKYEQGRLLGQGTFAKVYHARDLKTSQSVAIKVIDKEKVLKVGMMDQIKREISVMRLVRHPNIVQLHEVMATKGKIFFVMEYVKGGELFSRVAKGRLKEEAVHKFFRQLISAVDFCHSRGVYHRDLKPENLLLDENGNLKVSDFGLSALAESKRQDGLLHTTCGTPAYVAPEVIQRIGYDGAMADVWSCGVILFVLLSGYLPFHDSNLMEMYRKIRRAEFKCPSWFPSDVRRLLSKILDPDPASRISTARIMESSWFLKNFGEEKKKKKIKPAEVAENEAGLRADGGEVAEGKREAVKKEPAGVADGGEVVKPANAFDIISLSQGFDLSGLFEEADGRREARFVSKQPASVVISKLEAMAKALKLKLKKKGGGVMQMESRKEGKKGAIAIAAEIFEVTPSFHLVEMKKTSGDTLEYQRLWNQSIRPSLKDIVWAWQGEDRPQQDQPACS
ncbi:unnamed protein product [Spirodela intermedia]|uniref:non-specific serine/threonine protein kinase n=1 Tax=Spirodela intermedia TaxID=51605 RepID=A0A7I8IV47_SPIIN|nr:unnamed protein product [Spirodela intermedia]CAA6661867.1 unnamed protein product [Spirodela intermedia]